MKQTLMDSDGKVSIYGV